MFKRLAVIALILFATIACDSDQSLSHPSNWGSDFTDRSPPTGECPGGTLSHLRTSMVVSQLNDLAALRELVPNVNLPPLSQGDTLHTFQFSTAPDSGSFWGFSGYLVARDNCIVHAKITGHDN
jgi:hypothetical protein